MQKFSSNFTIPETLVKKKENFTSPICAAYYNNRVIIAAQQNYSYETGISLDPLFSSKSEHFYQGIHLFSRAIENNNLNIKNNQSTESKNWSDSAASNLLSDDNKKTAPADLPVLNPYIYTDNQNASLIVVGDYLYFIWKQIIDLPSEIIIFKEELSHPKLFKGKVYAQKLGASSEIGGGYAWSSPMELVSGNINAITSNFSVTAWGDYLLACYNTGDTLTYISAFDSKSWDDTGDKPKWNAIKNWSTNFQVFKKASKIFSSGNSIGNQISMDWFSVLGNQTYLIISFYDSKSKEAMVFHAMQLKPVESWNENQVFSHWTVDKFEQVSQTSGVRLLRDPAGRIKAYYRDSNSNIKSGPLLLQAAKIRILSTNKMNSDGLMWAKFGKAKAIFPSLPTSTLEGLSPIVPVFVLGSSEQDGTDPDSGQPKYSRLVYEFTFSSITDKADLGILNYVYDIYGKAIKIPNIAKMKASDIVVDTNKRVLKGIFDSPFPIPAVNLLTEGKFTNDTTLVQVEYGYTESENKEMTSTWNTSYGVTSSGSFTAGVGPAWDMAFNSGTGGAFGKTNSTQLNSSIISNSEVFKSGDLKDQGMFVNTEMTFIRTGYQFWDLIEEENNYTFKKAKNIQAISVITMHLEDGEDIPFAPYSVRTGDLNSYMVEAWNKRMYMLGYGKKYFEEVIEKKALFLFGNQNYISGSWSSAGDTEPNFKAYKSSYTSTSFQTNAKTYGGISGGVSVGFAGVSIAAANFKVLFGMTYTEKSNTTTSKDDSWGINLNFLKSAAISHDQGVKGGITGFNFKIYLLGPDKQWTTELLRNGRYIDDKPFDGTKIDPNSTPWRIVFIITDYTTQSGGTFSTPRIIEGKHTIQSNQWKHILATNDKGKVLQSIDLVGVDNTTWRITKPDGSVDFAPLCFGDTVGLQIVGHGKQGYLSAQKGSTPDLTLQPDIHKNELWQLINPKNEGSTDIITPKDLVGFLSKSQDSEMYLSARYDDQQVNLVSKFSDWEYWVIY